MADNRNTLMPTLPMRMAIADDEERPARRPHASETISTQSTEGAICSRHGPEIEAVREAFRSGRTVQQIAAHFGVSVTFVYTICRKGGITLRPSISEAQRRAIIHEAHKGATIMSLMRKYHVGYHRIRTILDNARTQPLKDSSRRLLRVVALLENTPMTFAEIGQHVGTSAQRIHQIYTEALSAGIRFSHRSKS
ncbi:MAG: sigma factor-like helix-turn-helix DNA-binding protein [Phycisphaerae bacterium]